MPTVDAGVALAPTVGALEVLNVDSLAVVAAIEVIEVEDVLRNGALPIPDTPPGDVLRDREPMPIEPTARTASQRDTRAARRTARHSTGTATHRSFPLLS